MLDTRKLRQLRGRLGITQEQAAKKAGLRSRQHWNKIEAGRAGSITLDTLGRVAKALGVKATDLLR
jgi:transcriptional regulator with XRE-family HTH domain